VSSPLFQGELIPLMFAAQFYESDPLQWADMPYWVGVWFQTVGGFAALGLLFWFIVHLSAGPNRPGGLTGIARLIFLLGVIGAAVSYGLLGFLKAPDALRALSAFVSGRNFNPTTVPAYLQNFQQILLLTGGVGSILAVLVPFVVDNIHLRWRRI